MAAVAVGGDGCVLQGMVARMFLGSLVHLKLVDGCVECLGVLLL